MHKTAFEKQADAWRAAMTGYLVFSTLHTNDGMETLRTDVWRRVLKGQTTVEEIARVTQADDDMSETD